MLFIPSRQEQEDYRNAVQHLALQYSQYIRWKMEDDDAALAEQMTGYPAEQDAFHLESLEEQKKVWFSGIRKETFVALQNGFAGIRAAGRAGTRTGPAGMV